MAIKNIKLDIDTSYSLRDLSFNNTECDLAELQFLIPSSANNSLFYLVLQNSTGTITVPLKKSSEQSKTHSIFVCENYRLNFKGEYQAYLVCFDLTSRLCSVTNEIPVSLVTDKYITCDFISSMIELRNDLETKYSQILKMTELNIKIANDISNKKGE